MNALGLTGSALDTENLVATFDAIISSARSTEKERDSLSRKTASLEIQIPRLIQEATRAAHENERYSKLVEEQSSTIRQLREDIIILTSSSAEKSQLSIDLCKEHAKSEKLKQQLEVELRNSQSLTAELNATQERVKHEIQANQSLRAQLRRGVQPIFSVPATQVDDMRFASGIHRS